ncbi:MAG: hypothetical protein ACI4RQ_06305 [Methanobrevibacter wolinii]
MTENKNNQREEVKKDLKNNSNAKKSKVTLISLIDENNSLHMGMLAYNNLTPQFVEEKRLLNSFQEDKIMPSITLSEFRKKLIQYKNKEI